MEGFAFSEVMLLLIVIVFAVGVVGVGAYLVVRQALERLFEGGDETFETRVLDELDVLRVRLDRISERLELNSAENLGTAAEDQKQFPSDSQEHPSPEDAAQ